MSDIETRLRQYFQSKSQQLLAAAQQAVCEHTGLQGSHRELIISLYLGEILPRRFGVGRGMVYGIAHRSREADIVIWDAENYPSLQMHGHNLFFAESVRAVLEIKTHWNSNEFDDVLNKCQAVRNIVPMKKPNLADDIAMLELEVASLRQNKEHGGMLIKGHHIATAAIMLYGGNTFSPSILKDDDSLMRVDDSWPDALLLLEQGKVIVKHYDQDVDSRMGGEGHVEFMEAGEDALLVFTAALLGLITERSVQVEDPLYLAQYVSHRMRRIPNEFIKFPLTRPVPGRMPLWH
jgi:hypothetical protein